MDTIQNEGTINLTAQSTLVSESRSYKIFGVGIADADSTSLAIRYRNRWRRRNQHHYQYIHRLNHSIFQCERNGNRCGSRYR